ncbi:MAG: response regulator [Desulfuromonadaceae bacterium]
MKTAMVVDRDPKIRCQVGKVLENCGFGSVIEAETGTQAVALARQHKSLLIVMDIPCPVIEGITAVENISNILAVPIVLLTATEDPEIIAKAREVGVMSYVLKPFRDAQLHAAVDLTIHQFIEVSHLREEVAHLKETIESRKRIERAKGILIKQGLSEPEAYRRMQKIAMDKRKPLREVAEAILLMED